MLTIFTIFSISRPLSPFVGDFQSGRTNRCLKDREGPESGLSLVKGNNVLG